VSRGLTKADSLLSLSATACAGLEREPGRRPQERASTSPTPASNTPTSCRASSGLASLPRRPETVDERRPNRDDGEIENERLGRSEPGSDKGEARDDKRSHHAAKDDLQSLSRDQARVGKRKAVDHNSNQNER